MIKYNELPQDIQLEISKLAIQYPYTHEEIVKYYLMGGKFTEKLLKMKLVGIADKTIIEECDNMYAKIE